MPNFPPNPYPGQTVSWQGYEYQWNGVQWINLAFPNPAIVPVYVSASEPQPPIIPGSFWFSPITSELSVWVKQDETYVWESAIGSTVEQPFVYVSASAPTSPVNGTLWYQPAQQVLRIWVVNGLSEGWIVLIDNTPQNPDPSTVLVSTSPPVDPGLGLLWFNPITNLLKVWVTTLAGSSWRTISGSNPQSKPTVYVTASPPVNPVQGDLWWMPTLQELKVWNVSPVGDSWLLITDNTPQAQVPPVYISVDEPVNPKLRYLWFNPQNGELKVWDGEEWSLVSTSSTPFPPPAKVSVSPPVGANEGDLWFNPLNGTLSVWYVDIDGGQWVSTSIQGPPGPEGPEGPAGPAGPIRVGSVLIDAALSGTVYVGTAPTGSEESQDVWTIVRTLYDSAGVRIDKGTATDVNWTDRYSHIYTV